MKILKYIKIWILISLFFTSIYAMKIGDVFEVNIKDEKISIVSNKMVYYFASFVSPSGKISNPILIDRNDAKLKINTGDFNLTFDGYTPIITYDKPESVFSLDTKETKIERPIDYSKDWKNSTLIFQGGSLNSFFNSEYTANTNNRHWWIFLLNLSVFPQLIADSMGSGEKIAKRFPALINALTKIGKFKNRVDELNFYYTLTLYQAEVFSKLALSFRDEQVPIAEWIVEYTGYYKYIIINI